MRDLSSLKKKLDQVAIVKKLRETYKSLEDRDRNAVKVLSVAFISLFIYFGIWSPLNEYKTTSKKNRDRQLELIQWMRETEKVASVSSNAGGGQVSGQNLLTQVSRTTQKYNITPNRLQPEGENAVSVWFDSVAFNDLVKWLQQLQKQGGIDVKQISVDGQPQSGLVAVRMVLTSIQ